MVNDPAFFVSHRLVLAKAARDAGYEVIVATGPGDGTADITDAGFEHHALPLSRSGTSALAEVRLFLSIAMLYRSVRPHLVHLVTIKPVLYGGALARVMRVPAVVAAITGMGYLFTGARRRYLQLVVKYGYRVALGHLNGRVILQNEEDWQSLAGMGALKPGAGVLIPGSGVDLKIFRPSPLPAPPPIVVLPARMLWDKGVGEFVDAARILRRRRTDVRFVLVGPCDPDNPAAIDRRQLESWVAEGCIEWWGPRNDMPDVLARSSLVVLPSYREGMPKVLLEAAAAGRAIVTTDAPGCRQAIVPGASGELVPVRDAPALATAIDHLLADRLHLRDMGRAGRAIAEQGFGIESVVLAHVAIYRALFERMREPQAV